MKNIKKLIKKGESETLEFKPSLSQAKEIIKTISALSNTKGGSIIIGVDDKGNVIGVVIGKQTLESLANEIKQNTDPRVYPSISVEDIDSKNVVIIQAKESKTKPVFAFNMVYKRVGKSSHRVSSGEIRKMALEEKKVYWDSEICEGATLDDIDEEKVRMFLRKARTERNFDVEPETSAKEALERLGLMKNGKLTNAAILLFGKKPQKFFLQAETRCARFKGTKPVKPFLDMKIFNGNIIDQVDKVLSFVLEHTPMKVYLAGKPAREEKYEYPPNAIREAIINAICHRDYELPSHVQVRIFDDRIEVWGCGPLPNPLTPEDLKKKHRSVLRNPLIGKCFFLIKFIEEWGTGTNDMIKMCLDWGLPEPLFEYVADDLVVTFRKSRLTEEFLGEMGLNQRQKKAIEYIKEKGEITRSEYTRITNISTRMANIDLKDLVKRGLIKKQGKGRSTHYILK